MKTVALVAAALAAASPAPRDDAAAVVLRAVQALAAQRQGVVAFAMHYAYEERGPAHHVTTVIDSMRLRKDGTLVAVRLLGEVKNGGAVSAGELANDQAKIDARPPADPYRLPLTEEGLRDYRFAYPTEGCADCTSGSVAIAFTSLKRDADHGDGILVVDPTGNKFLSVTFHPSVLPPRADSGSIEMSFSAALTDLWDLSTTHEHYTGHVLFMHGWGDVLTTYRSYRRFGSVAEGLKALAAAVPQTGATQRR